MQSTNLKDYIPELCLASGSPARLELLKDMGIAVHVFPQNCFEFTNETEPGKVVESLSRIKLESYLKSSDFNPDLPALACDTLLWFKDNFIGKAHSAQEAYDQISSLAGNVHQVFTGYSLYYKGKTYNGSDFANVEFTEITEEKLNSYIASNEWKGAAGSYHIFGIAVDFIKNVTGDVNTVKGLPVNALISLFNSIK